MVKALEYIAELLQTYCPCQYLWSLEQGLLTIPKTKVRSKGD